MNDGPSIISQDLDAGIIKDGEASVPNRDISGDLMFISSFMKIDKLLSII